VLYSTPVQPGFNQGLLQGASVAITIGQDVKKERTAPLVRSLVNHNCLTNGTLAVLVISLIVSPAISLYAGAQRGTRRLERHLYLILKRPVQRELDLQSDQIQKVDVLLKELAQVHRRELRKQLRRLRSLPLEQQTDRVSRVYRHVRDEVRTYYHQKLTKILTSKQHQRYREIIFQQQEGPFVFAWPEISCTLELDTQQQEAIDKICSRTLRLFQRLGTPQETDAETLQKWRDQLQEIRTSSRQDVIDLLNAAQHKRWQQVQGAPLQIPG